MAPPSGSLGIFKKAVGGYFQTLMSSASAAMPAALTAKAALQPAADNPLAQNLSRVLSRKRPKHEQEGVNLTELLQGWASTRIVWLGWVNFDLTYHLALP